MSTYTNRDVMRMIEGELNRITAAKEKLAEAREAEVIAESRKRLARKPPAQAAAKPTATRDRKVRPAITSYQHASGRVEILDPDHRELWSHEAREVEAEWAAVDRGRRCERGYLISAPCSEQVRIR